MKNDGVSEGEASVLPDSGSVTEIMPTQVAHSLNLVLHKVNHMKYSLQTANGYPIRVNVETSLELCSSPSKRFSIPCFVSDSLKSTDIIISWRSMVALGMLIYPDSVLHPLALPLT